jgi:hypothetical protein
MRDWGLGFGWTWMIPEQDILHIKSFILNKIGDVYTLPGMRARISRWGLETSIPPTSDKWFARPTDFVNIKALAISRDALVHLEDDYETVIRHFFPNLLVLMVLIDDETDIDAEWSIFDSNYVRYEGKIAGGLTPNSAIRPKPRIPFIMEGKGAFKEVKKNDEYQLAVEYEMRRRFLKEEADYDWYVAPEIRVLACSVPDGVEIPECGRTPSVSESQIIAELGKARANATKLYGTPYALGRRSEFSSPTPLGWRLGGLGGRA